MMKALVKQGPELRVRDVPRPVAARGEVLVRVSVAGVCRTDVFAARGLVPSIDPVILGHEFSGVVCEGAGDAEGLSPGTRVAVNPVLPCGECARCSRGECCARPTMLGLDRHGAFAELIAVPASAGHPSRRA